MPGRATGLWIALALFVISSVVLSCLIGSVHVPLGAVVAGLAQRLSGSSQPESPLVTIFFDLRLPRVLLGLLCGAALSLSGGVMQGVFRNPLADPYVLGTVSGATFGAALTILFHLDGSLWALPLGAFLGALLSTAVMLAASELRMQLYFDHGALILVGVALGSLLSALTGIVLFASRADQVQSLVYWLFGSLSTGQWPQLGLFALLAIPTMGLLVRQARVLDLLSLGDAMALHLGIEVTSHKRKLMLLSSLLTALSVAACGTIGFVGLVVPHIMRRLVGPGHRSLLLSSLLFGGAFLPLCDTVARSLFAPVEIPVGIITALVGVPFFLSLLLRRARLGTLS
ncbi:MAG TPA: iron ABC transporter permease [Pseudomonadota bacterium]|nr:iron ABC transporter permease [Pseudomonadota bacterium]